MDYMDREGHRIKKTTGQDKLLKVAYTHTATRILMRPLLLPAVSRLGGKLLNTKVSAVCRTICQNPRDRSEQI